ncbi:hypothetical protein GCM10010124_26910 [Pilimelia terevasa]|uniref:Uncharacterized protein n=1 Tax=Pilimelia terevasa TaxID=53372 RepID=A0A8J3BSQ8_9ACTN|nr:hypothetical protein [Pilimelia terevasa]GGK32761.1 hypothetical protein GCM10010124_26910 [Pilimelia terevasa]
MTDSRSSYLHTLAAQVWPAPARPAVRRGGPGYVVVPGVRDPRLLVSGSGRAAAAAVRASLVPPTRRARLRQAAVGALFRVGLGRLAFRYRLDPGDPQGVGLDRHLAAVCGSEVRLSAHLGPPRATRKPVLQLRTPAGAPAGYAKLGVDPLTCRLVAAEAAALRRLAGLDLGPVVVPHLRHHGRWRGAELLVQSALPVHLPPATPAAAAAAVRDAMVEVSRAAGVRRGRLRGSGYAAGLAARVTALGPRPERPRLAALLARAGAEDPVTAFGCWHGDWNGGNGLALADGRVLVWDWERFAEDVPVGFDALHHRLQRDFSAGVAPWRAAAGLLRDAAGCLRQFDQPAPAALIALLYLVDLAARYLADGQRAAGSAVGDVGAWLVPAAEEHLERSRSR